jgi:thioredoxin reductase (NADPH)
VAKVAVVGAGPAGMAAAIQLVRAGHEIQVFEKSRVGGALLNARWVENYPGFPGGITGPELAALMESQFLDCVDDIANNEVGEIETTDAGFSVMGMVFDGVIVCTGTVPKKAGFQGEDELAAAGLLCYGIAERSDWHDVNTVAVIGGGEASIDMALNLAKGGTKVTLLHRSEPRGIHALTAQALGEGGIGWLRANVRGARVGDKAILETDLTELEFDRVLVAVGREPQMPKLTGFDPEDPPNGFLVAGDAARGSLGQTATAVGDGVEAAMAMHGYLEAGP